MSGIRFSIELLNIEPADALFVLNGFPYEIATGNETWAVEGHAGRMMALFAAEAEARGYEVVDLQPVENEADQVNVTIEMTMTSPACPAGPQLIANSKSVVAQLDEVNEVEVKIVE